MSATAFELRTDKFKSMKLTLGGTKAAGALDKVNDTVGVYPVGGGSGDQVAFIYSAEKVYVPKDAGSDTGGDAGAKAYFNNSTKKVTAVSSGNTLCGRFLEDAADADTYATIDLNGEVAA